MEARGQAVVPSHQPRGGHRPPLARPVLCVLLVGRGNPPDLPRADLGQLPLLERSSPL